MPKYRLHCNVEAASGTQYFTVDAENEADALRKCNAGECEFDYEEVEVTELSKPHEVELVDDSSTPTVKH